MLPTSTKQLSPLVFNCPSHGLKASEDPMCSCLFYLLIRRGQFNLNINIYIYYWYQILLFTCHILLDTSSRNWPSGPQEEIFKCVGTLHSRVLRLQINRKQLLTVVGQQAHTHVREYQNIRDGSLRQDWNPLHSQHHYTRVSFSCYILNSKKPFCNSQQPSTAPWLGQTSPDWLLIIYSSVTYHFIRPYKLEFRFSAKNKIISDKVAGPKL